MARWLVQRGAGHVALLSRSGQVAKGTEEHWEWLQQCSAQVKVWRCDVADKEAVGRTLQEIHEAAPMRGVVHAAGVLADGMLEKQTEEKLRKVWGPKVDGARHVHDAVVELGCELDHLVLFSSVASLLGSAGQGNYAAANAALDGLAVQWRREGLPAVSIQWGAWVGGGMATESGAERRLHAVGMRGIEHDEAAL